MLQSVCAKTISDLQFEFSQQNELHVSPCKRKWKLSQVKSHNTKLLHCNLDNLRMPGDSIQEMMFLHSNESLLI